MRDINENICMSCSKNYGKNKMCKKCLNMIAKRALKILKSEAKKEKAKDQQLYNKSVNNMSLFV